MAEDTQRPGKFNPVRQRTLDLALDYVAKHFGTRYLFPIKRGKKFPPLIRNNLELASNDPEQLRAWEAQWPSCNWGVAHRKSRLLVADVDTNKAKGKVGDVTFAELQEKFGWPETEMTTTPSGGFHKIYEGWATDEHPEHIMALGENGIGKDIDSPNYTLIPGCKFDDGTKYVGNGADAVKCPEWIYDTIKTSKTKSRIADAGEVVVELDQEANITLAIDFLQNDAKPSIAGQLGDNTLFKVAAYLKDIGISQELGAQLLEEYFNPRCEPAWPAEMFVAKMASAYKSGNLSKVGGRTAEADFADDPPPPITPMGEPEVIAQQVADRKNIAPLVEGKRPIINYRSQNMPRAVRDAMNAIRSDKKHDHIFRRGPEIVRLNQNLTAAELEGKKTDLKRKRGSLVIRDVVGDYMAFRLAEAARFVVKGKPMGRPKTDGKDA